MKMKFFGKNLDSSSLLRCCTLSEQKFSPIDAEIPVRIEKYQPCSVPSPAPEPQRRPSCRDKEFLTRKKRLISHTPIRRDTSEFEKYSDAQKTPISSGPNSPLIFSSEEENSDKIDSIFKPLNLKSPNLDSNCSSALSRTYSENSRVSTNTGRQQLEPGNAQAPSRTARSTLSISELNKHYSPSLPLSDGILNQAYNPKFASHMRIRSDSVINQRIRIALDEKEKLTQRLKTIEDDIHRKNPIFPHPLKSAPTRPSTQPTGRSFSLSSQSSRPDWGVPVPPLPLIFHTSNQTRRKSLSRVSCWLTATGQNECARQSSVTNMPKPVTEREGFYNCIGSSQLSTETEISTTDYNSDQPTLCISLDSSCTFRSDVFGFGGTEHDYYCDKTIETPKENSGSSLQKLNTECICGESNFGIAF
ncbi:hypothetical protein Golomagni_00847 [Golovinomyces magnicellulatus]|nr:hypothetical protein Golomagni_00847 [Golovinomyces magnicellulatus]